MYKKRSWNNYYIVQSFKLFSFFCLAIVSYFVLLDQNKMNGMMIDGIVMIANAAQSSWNVRKQWALIVVNFIQTKYNKIISQKKWQSWQRTITFSTAEHNPAGKSYECVIYLHNKLFKQKTTRSFHFNIRGENEDILVWSPDHR